MFSIVNFEQVNADWVCDVYLNRIILTIGTIGGLLTNLHCEIKKITGSMTKNLLVGGTQLDVTYSKVSLWAKFVRFSSVMVACYHQKTPLKKKFLEPGT